MAIRQGITLRSLSIGALVAWAALSVLMSTPAPAQPADDPDFISLGAGAYDVIGNSSHPSGLFAAEYRFGYKLWIFKPFLGVLGNTDKSYYGYGGFLVDIYLGPRWVLTPNVAAGYFHQGSGTVLGNHAEFRTGVEIAYRFDDRSRLGFSVHHISNAGIGTHNPGEEDGLIVFSLPFDLLK
jgi:lipid A 3-O-deacylase